MRSSVIGVMSVALVACGVFGSDDPEPAPPTPEQEEKKAGENAEPPPPGEPLTGVFVSSSKGNDEGSGTMENPVKTLARALVLGRERSVRVLACAEDYPESLTLLDGVSAFGNIDCKANEWIVGTARARIVSPTSPAVKAKDLKLTTKLEGFEVIAPDLDGTPATDEAGSSIGLDVRDSKGLVVVGSLLHGGKGAAGTDGVEGELNDRTAASNGTDAIDQSTTVTCNPVIVADCTNRPVIGPAGGVTTCKIGPNGGPGGKGGDGRWFANGVESTLAAEFRGLPLVATAATGVGGLNQSADGSGRGLPAPKGERGAVGKDGTNGVWFLTAFGFVRGNGTKGEAGAPGQGGGGGGGARYFFGPSGQPASPANAPYHKSPTGGGGGGGGCGGQPGTPATGGGASVGAFIVKSSVSIERTRIESSSGGRAGKGNLGTPGIPGGTGGLGTSHGVPTTGAGGDGGGGGPGGASGHGAAGPSIAIAYTEKPTLTETQLAPGPAGDGQPELKQAISPGVFRTLPAVVGESKPEHVIKQ